ncbi:MAG TPA: hypothetical protein VFQ47_08230 [Nitrososphaera sp.]|jgi:hypothetical protein|nr:hypothetical protein [Nitrososphaera sp.]
MNTIDQDIDERLDRIEAWMDKVEQAVRGGTLDVDPETLARLRRALRQ